MNRRTLLRQGLTSMAAIVALNPKDLVAICKPGLTPKQAKGPFYPVVDQLDKDWDLTNVRGNPQSARGQVIIIEGIVTDDNCKAVSGVLVEIWQACESGRYDHPSDPNNAPLDPNFQYWGKAVTDANGKYRFRTILPGAYPADDTWMRPPHIHFKVSRLGYKELITQLYFEGQELNNQDLILQGLDPEEQAQVIVSLKKVGTESTPVGNFNIEIAKINKPKRSNL